MPRNIKSWGIQMIIKSMLPTFQIASFTEKIKVQLNEFDYFFLSAGFSSIPSCNIIPKSSSNPHHSFILPLFIVNK